jgi:Cd(II)/Pb(II)-responsive transcriptional regulator
MTIMKIGELAQASATPIETIRFYEREGLLPHAARTQNNYRIYEQDHVDRLIFVRHCRSLDMALDEIRQLLKFKDSPQESCADVNDLLDEHIGHVAQRMGELRTLQRQLKALRAQCGQETAVQACGILEQLASEPSAILAQTSKRRHVRGTH